ncbi:MAG: hypothetical protein UT33_C0009G0043 [Candidatus Peregrinibacteria bacterium GW2011_GWC2_39_14]|nr:MAG: hypothetical protein US92_C0005G0043 [Candidatus Peregrinibacteria bacterium GW2011_GWA2_38_36]KKR06592.1 MAG: hypothetical protein UT33_C0009G0043 [Candidatus Peregrinibacteria bacterium GW2011_GWC2_39_14]
MINPFNFKYFRILSVLLFVSIGIGALIFMILKVNSSFVATRNNLVAQSFLTEGIDAIRVVLDANSIKYDKKCWDFDQYTYGFKCETGKTFEGKYKLEPDFMPGTFGIKLTKINKDSVFANDYLVDKNSYRGQIVDTAFYRMIEIRHDEVDLLEDRLTVVATVGWYEGGGTKAFHS